MSANKTKPRCAQEIELGVCFNLQVICDFRVFIKEQMNVIPNDLFIAWELRVVVWFTASYANYFPLIFFFASG
jgi:hypothetical protein